MARALKFDYRRVHLGRYGTLKRAPAHIECGQRGEQTQLRGQRARVILRVSE